MNAERTIEENLEELAVIEESYKRPWLRIGLFYILPLLVLIGAILYANKSLFEMNEEITVLKELPSQNIELKKELKVALEDKGVLQSKIATLNKEKIEYLKLDGRFGENLNLVMCKNDSLESKLKIYEFQIAKYEREKTAIFALIVRARNFSRAKNMKETINGQFDFRAGIFEKNGVNYVFVPFNSRERAMQLNDNLGQLYPNREVIENLPEWLTE